MASGRPSRWICVWASSMNALGPVPGPEGLWPRSITRRLSAIDFTTPRAMLSGTRAGAGAGAWATAGAGLAAGGAGVWANAAGAASADADEHWNETTLNEAHRNLHL